jgi:hypothetical protein
MINNHRNLMILSIKILYYVSQTQQFIIIYESQVDDNMFRPSFNKAIIRSNIVAKEEHSKCIILYT